MSISIAVQSRGRQFLPDTVLILALYGSCMGLASSHLRHCVNVLSQQVEVLSARNVKSAERSSFCTPFSHSSVYGTLISLPKGGLLRGR